MSEPIPILFQLLMAIVAGPIWPITNIIYFDVYFMCLTFLQHDAGEKVGEDDKDSIGCQNKDNQFRQMVKNEIYCSLAFVLSWHVRFEICFADLTSFVIFALAFCLWSCVL